jgi:hypothetical protein
MGQPGFFNLDRRLEAISAKGDPLETIIRRWCRARTFGLALKLRRIWRSARAMLAKAL